MMRRVAAALLPALVVGCSRLWLAEAGPAPATPEPVLDAEADTTAIWMPPPPPPRVLAPPALARSDSIRAQTLAPGVIHTYAWQGRGPWAIHVLALDRAQCVDLSARKAGPPLGARAPTSELTFGALAGVNADFFVLPLGTTVGPHVSGGEILIGPTDRAVLGVDGPELWIDSARVDGQLEVTTTPADSIGVIPITQVNRPGDVTLYTAWAGDSIAADTLGRRASVRVERLDGAGALGRGIVIEVDSTGAAIALDTGVVVVAATADTARAALLRLALGDSVRWLAHLLPRATEAVGGFIVLVEDGQVTEMVSAGGTEFIETRHPRTAIGFADRGRRAWLVVVDGRQAPYSAGMTLLELAELMRDLGAEQALNLDGGGSTTMVVRGDVANRPSDEAGERPVGNALAVVAGCPAETGGRREAVGGRRD
ncbi:MAG: phosphodiester glycosidase family protein [Longimicrobiales bacterium]